MEKKFTKCQILSQMLLEFTAAFQANFKSSLPSNVRLKQNSKLCFCHLLYITPNFKWDDVRDMNMCANIGKKTRFAFV